MIRYRTRDLTRLLPGTARSMRRMEKITGRTDDMIILRGVNLFPTQIEEIVLGIPTLSPHFQCAPRPQRQPRHADGPRRATRRHDRRGGGRRADRAGAADQGVHRRQRRGRRRRRGLDRALGRQDAADRRPPRGALTGAYLPATGRRGLQWSQRFRRRAAVITPDPPDTAHLAPAPHLHAVACRQSRTGSPAPRRVPQSGRTPWPSASVNAAAAAPLRTPATRTTRASSPSWPAPCVSSSRPSSVARSPPAAGALPGGRAAGARGPPRRHAPRPS